MKAKERPPGIPLGGLFIGGSMTKHLKSLKNGVVFDWTPELGALKHMIPCDASGNMETGHISDVGDLGGSTRRKTLYLGNPRNGVLLDYTEALADLPHMVSMETVEQWNQWKEDNLGNVHPIIKEDTPALTREEAPSENTSDLPSINGMVARDAKTALSNWAEQRFGHKLDRRQTVEELVEQCEEMVASKAAAAG